MLNSGVITFVNRQRIGYVATVNPDNSPNLSPKGTLSAYDSKTLVFADIASPNTVRNILYNPRIEVNVVDVFSRKGFRFKGTARVISSGLEFNEFLLFYKQRGATTPPEKIKHIVLIDVHEVSEIYSPAYDEGFAEEQLQTKWKDYYNNE